MDNPWKREVIRSTLTVKRDKLLELDRVDLTFGLVLVQEHLNVFQAPFRFKLVVPTAVGVGGLLEAAPTRRRDVVLLAGVDEYLGPFDRFSRLVDDADVDGTSGGRGGKNWDEDAED